MDPPPIRVELGDHSPKLSLSWRRDLNVRTDHLADEGTEIDQITSPPSYQETDHCGGSNERAVVKSDLKYVRPPRIQSRPFQPRVERNSRNISGNEHKHNEPSNDHDVSSTDRLDFFRKGLYYDYLVRSGSVCKCHSFKIFCTYCKDLLVISNKLTRQSHIFQLKNVVRLIYEVA